MKEFTDDQLQYLEYNILNTVFDSSGTNYQDWIINSEIKYKYDNQLGDLEEDVD